MLIACVVPTALAAIVLLSVYFGTRAGLSGSLSSRLGCQAKQMGCLGPALYGATFALAAVPFLLWALLRFAGVRPAWPVVLIGLAITVILGSAYSNSVLKSAITVPGLGPCLVLAASYAAAAVLTTSSVRRSWRIGLAIVIVALLPLSFL